MAQGNLLEIILSDDVEKKFKAIDQRLESIEKHTSNTVKSIGGLSATLVQEFGVMNKGVEELTSSINRLTVAISKMGNVSTTAVGNTANNVTNAAEQLNRLYNMRLQYYNKIAQLDRGRTVANMKGDDTKDYTEAIKKYGHQVDVIQKKIDKLAAKHQEAAKEAKLLFETKQAAQEIQNQERKTAAIQRTTEALRKLDEQNKRNAQRTFNASLGITEKPQTIEQYRIAIANLRKEIEKLSPDDKSGIAKLNKQIAEYENKLKSAEDGQKKFQQVSNSLGNTMKNLAATFGVVFSVQSLVNFGKKVVEITGEFELQHRAMQAIIGDYDQANKLFDKTVRLAVKSPYRIKDLVSYTKQLAAYRIETDKLYDTTKMLADISSGLGVDMQRLILAYGQVKAANYLRGQELRQFSEAGVNILGELSKYFSELQGRAISTGDVFEMVSKRMVKFEDVANVLRRLTEEGGIFFNMQEIQAETIKGQMENLKDSIDVFMNSIGEKYRNNIVNTIKAIRNGLEDINGIMPVLTTAFVGLAASFAAARINAARGVILEKGWAGLLGKNIQVMLQSMKLNNLQKAIANAQQGQENKLIEQRIILEERLNKAKAAGGSSVMGWVTVITAVAVGIASIVSKLTETRRALNKINDETKKIVVNRKDRLDDEVKNYKILVQKIEGTNQGSKEREELIRKLNTQYGEYIDNLDGETASNEDLAGSIAEVNERMKEKAALEAYQSGLEKINEEFEKIFTEQGQELIEHIETIGFKIQQADGSFKNFAVNRKDAAAIVSELKEMAQSVPAKEWDTASERAKKFMEIVRKYFGRDDLEMLGGMNPIENLLDAYAKMPGKIKELDDQISAQFKTTGVKELDEQIKSISDTLDETIKKWRGKPLLEISPDEDHARTELERIINKLKLEAAKKVIKLKVKYGVMSEDGGKDAAESLDKWETQTVKSINEKLRGLKGKFKEYDIFNLLELTESNVKDGVDKQIDAWKSSYEGWKQTYDGLIRKQKAKINVDKEEMANAKYMMELYLEAGKVVGEDFSKKKGGRANPALDTLNKQIDAIKNASRQYEEYKEMYEDTKAFDKTKESVKDLFKELNISHVLDTENAFDKGVIQKQLETTWLASSISAAGKAGSESAKKYVSTLQVELEKENYKEDVTKLFKASFDDILDMISVSDDLKDLGVGEKFAKTMFGVDTKTTEDAWKLVNDWRNALEANGRFGETMQEEYRKAVEKIQDIEDKAQKERVKKYISYMRNAMSERARIEVEGLAEIRDIETMFQGEIRKAQAVGDSAREARLQNMAKTAVDASRKATEDKMTKQMWDEFKKSDTFVELFNDLDNASTKALESMRKKIQEYIGSLKLLEDPTELKAAVGEIDKLEKELVSRNPFKRMLEYVKQIKTLNTGGESEKSLLERYDKLDSKLSDAKEEAVRLEKELFRLEHLSNGEAAKMFSTGDEWQEAIDNMRDMISQKMKDIDLTEEEIAKLKELLELYDKLRGSADSFSKQWKEGTQKIKGAFDSVWKNLDAFGVKTDETTEAWGGLFDSILDLTAMLPAYVAAMTAAGTATNSALGVIGLIAEAISLVVGVIGAVGNIRNARIDKEIKGYKEEVEDLEEAYKKAEEAFDNAWDVKKLQAYRNEMRKNTDEQIKYIEKQIDAENRRKSPDESAIREWKKQRDEMRESYKQLDDDFTKEVGGLGKDGYKDAAQGFVDAWYDAFKETGDGLDALRDSFNGILENMVKKQAVMRLTNKLLEPLFEKIDEAVSDGTLSTSEMDMINNLAESTFPELNEKLKDFFSSLGMFGDKASGELTGLQKGIQGITEDTAEILAAYLNSIRFTVIDSNSKLSQLVSVIQDSTGTINPMLGELRNIRQKTNDIYNFLWQRRESGSDSMRVYVVN